MEFRVESIPDEDSVYAWSDIREKIEDGETLVIPYSQADDCRGRGGRERLSVMLNRCIGIPVTVRQRHDYMDFLVSKTPLSVKEHAGFTMLGYKLGVERKVASQPGNLHNVGRDFDASKIEARIYAYMTQVPDWKYETKQEKEAAFACMYGTSPVTDALRGLDCVGVIVDDMERRAESHQADAARYGGNDTFQWSANSKMFVRDSLGMEKPHRKTKPPVPALSGVQLRGYSNSFLGWPAALPTEDKS